jgi:hypothetical protein
MTDHRTPRPRCECGHTQTFHGSGMGPCSYSNGYATTCECQAYREPAAEPPAPPAQVLTPFTDEQIADELEGEELACGNRTSRTYAMLTDYRALRAEVARLQEERTQLKAAQEAPK